MEGGEGRGEEGKGGEGRGGKGSRREGSAVEKIILILRADLIANLSQSNTEVY